MTDIPKIVHDPNAVLDYEWDWSKWLAEGEIITNATCSITTAIEPGEITVNPAGHSTDHTDTTVTCWVGGGRVGRIYRLVAHTTTDAGRVDDRTILLECKER